MPNAGSEPFSIVGSLSRRRRRCRTARHTTSSRHNACAWINLRRPSLARTDAGSRRLDPCSCTSPASARCSACVPPETWSVRPGGVVVRLVRTPRPSGANTSIDAAPRRYRCARSSGLIPSTAKPERFNLGHETSHRGTDTARSQTLLVQTRPSRSRSSESHSNTRRTARPSSSTTKTNHSAPSCGSASSAQPSTRSNTDGYFSLTNSTQACTPSSSNGSSASLPERSDEPEPGPAHLQRARPQPRRLHR